MNELQAKTNEYVEKGIRFVNETHDTFEGGVRFVEERHKELLKKERVFFNKVFWYIK